MLVQEISPMAADAFCLLPPESIPEDSPPLFFFLPTAEPEPLDLCWARVEGDRLIIGQYYPHERGADFKQRTRTIRAYEYEILGVFLPAFQCFPVSEFEVMIGG